MITLITGQKNGKDPHASCPFSITKIPIPVDSES